MVGYVVGSKPIRRRKMNPRRHSRHRHRNPRFSVPGLVGQLKAGLIGGAGGIANALLMGVVTPRLPAVVATGYPLHGVRIASAAAIGWAGRKFAGRMGAQLGEGAMVVAMYLLLKDVTTSMVPSLPLGDYQEIELAHPASVLGAYMEGRALSQNLSGAEPGMAAYMEGLGADSVVEY